MKKVILVCEALQNYGGIERMTIELANLLSGEYKIIIVTIELFSYDSCPFKIDPRVKVISLDTSFKKSICNLNVHIIKSLRNIFKNDKPDIIITVSTPLVRLTVPACICFKTRNIAWEHFNIYAGSKMGTIFKIFSTWFVNNTVVLTNKDKKDYKRNFAPRIVTIPNFTSIGNNEPSKCENRLLLAVGRHTNQKGFDLLIKAWSKSKVPGWKLRIVGSGNDKIKNEQFAKNLGVWDNIEFIEAHHEISKEFQNASCFVLPSRYEGFVLVLIEAKMMGLPCISFDCPNSPAEIIHNGVDGILVPPEDVDALAKAITSALQDMSQLKKMGVMARKDAMERYNVESIKSKWNNLLK